MGIRHAKQWLDYLAKVGNCAHLAKVFCSRHNVEVCRKVCCISPRVSDVVHSNSSVSY